MHANRLILFLAASVCTTFALFGQAPGEWEQPAAALAEQIAELMGPGQARLAIRDQSSVPVDEIPAIRRLLEQGLKTRGVTASGAESANLIRVTLSESATERVWVAEVVQGSETRVTMVRMGLERAEGASDAERLRLRKEKYLGSFELDRLPCFPDTKPPLLGVVETRRGLAVLKEGCLLALDRYPDGFGDGKGFYHLEANQALTRDSRGILTVAADGDGFLAYFPGTACAGSYTPSNEHDPPPGESWSLRCHPSDDPWPIAQIPEATGAADGVAHGATVIKAFYNAARNYFTGVVTPSVGADLPPFYSAAVLPRPAGAALLIGGIDGKVQMAENGALKTVSGTRDWGSDFAVLHSGCGAGDQVIASGSGEAVSDSLRAYELPALEALPASAPLAMDGTVTALWTAPDGKSVLANVRHADGENEVDRVTALCD